MVFQWFFYMWTIGINGFSMVFLHVNHWCQWFFNGFFRSQPFVSMVFPMVFYNRTIAIEWMVCGSPFTSMVYQWFWGKWTLVHKKRPKRKKTWFVQQKHRNKQTLDMLGNKPNIPGGKGSWSWGFPRSRGRSIRHKTAMWYLTKTLASWIKTLQPAGVVLPEATAAGSHNVCK